MTQQLNISISDDLYNRLHIIRNKKIFNISEICQDVIEKEIIRLEEMKERIKNLTNINISKTCTDALEKVINDIEDLPSSF